MCQTPRVEQDFFGGLQTLKLKAATLLSCANSNYLELRRRTAGNHQTVHPATNST